MSFSNSEFTRRLVMFCIFLPIVMVLCVFHGLSAKSKAIYLIDQMIAKGNLTGKFWRVIQSQNGQITITKYQRTIALVSAFPKDAHIGDRISFIAKIEKAKGKSAPPWHPTKIRFHGTSSFKYGISVLSVSLVLIMGLKYLRFDRKSFSLTFKGWQG